jgi:hypothetical protein
VGLHTRSCIYYAAVAIVSVGAITVVRFVYEEDNQQFTQLVVVLTTVDGQNYRQVSRHTHTERTDSLWLFCRRLVLS